MDLGDRQNVDDWFFLEQQKAKQRNVEEYKNDLMINRSFLENETSGAPHKIRGKSKEEHELKAMSQLSLYDDRNADKVKPVEADKASAEDTRDNSVHSSMQFDDMSIGVESRANTSLQITIDPPPDNDVIDFPKNPFGANKTVNSSLFFSDGIRSVDFVLVWKKVPEMTRHHETIENDRTSKRKIFEDNLYIEGLEIEYETVEEEINFVKIHAPLEVLRRYAEILKLRMPMKEIPGMSIVRTHTNSFLKQLKWGWGFMSKRFLQDEKHFPAMSHRFTAVYSRDKEYLFDLMQSTFFTSAVRSRIVQFILDRKRFMKPGDNDYAFGIERMISEQSYIAAYPLHDGEILVAGSRRNLLFTKWASLKKAFRYQPLDYIKDYFGVKIGLYFAWLGFYTYMLLLASIVGVAAFIYSLQMMKNNKVSEQICNGNTTIVMCPLCDNWCDYWNLKETCVQAKVTSLFDNPVTVAFAVFMSFWATLFLEHWKRYSAEITHRWDLTGFDVHEEHPRPDYLARLAKVKRKKLNVVTNTYEPEVPFFRMKLPATVLSISVVLLLIAMAFATVLGVVLYRMSVLAALSVYGKRLSTSYAILFTTATAASINLVLIVIFNWIYEFLAEYLTEMELLRTQTEFDDSLTLKIYLLQFVNYYASIFYIAFFKGKFVGHPRSYTRFFNYRQEECGLGGCLMELMIQLAIIMIGKQFMSAFVEMFLPMLLKKWNSLSLRLGKKRDRSLKSKGQRWINDLKLVEFGPRGLFPEYLEMVLQYGFVTIFVAAFPLAPLFALINNIFEMRLDAKKLLTYYRRPVSQRVRNIGVWYRILDSISKLSVITNGFIIAFTSDFVPRFIYQVFINPEHTLDGYVNFTLATFETKDLKEETKPFETQWANITMCRYQDYRNPPYHPEEYEISATYWKIMAGRLIFVVLFENFVAIVMIIVRWMIPDMSQELRDQIRREAYITNEIIIKQEAIRASSGTTRVPTVTNQSQWNNLLRNKLSGSQLDLFIHDQEQFRSNNVKHTKETENFLNSESRASNSAATPNNNNVGEETHV
ncbi:unnamed protein product [Diamesa tonsa]